MAEAYTKEQAKKDMEAYMTGRGLKGTCEIKGEPFPFGSGSAYHATVTREAGGELKFFVFSDGHVIPDTTD